MNTRTTKSSDLPSVAAYRSPKYAAATKVTEEKTREQIDKLLKKYGAQQRVYGFDDEHSKARVQFAMQGRKLRFDLPMPYIGEFATYHAGARGVRPRPPGQMQIAWEQACRTRWRALALAIKAKLEAVESGIELFEEAFLANIVLADGSTVGEWVRPQIAEVYDSGRMPQLLPGVPGIEGYERPLELPPEGGER